MGSKMNSNCPNLGTVILNSDTFLNARTLLKTSSGGFEMIKLKSFENILSKTVFKFLLGQKTRKT